jgi:ribosomal protein S18 acetylase RimI-like enzyme
MPVTPAAQQEVSLLRAPRPALAGPPESPRPARPPGKTRLQRIWKGCLAMATRKPDSKALDNPAWAALTGPQAFFAEFNGQASRYRPDVSPFAALADWHDASAWKNLADMVGPGSYVVVAAADLEIPREWGLLGKEEAVQMVSNTPGSFLSELETAPEIDGDEIVVLTPVDVPDIVQLLDGEVHAFREHTLELGLYMGIRRQSRLVSMAGQRMKIPGGTELSGVFTAGSARRQGLAGKLIANVVAEAARRGDTTFLHVDAWRSGAIAMYKRLGFAERRRMLFAALQAPAARE